MIKAKRDFRLRANKYIITCQHFRWHSLQTSRSLFLCNRTCEKNILHLVERVTMKIDVSHTEHSHLIGKGGQNVKAMMVETKCHIHFPDSNRTNVFEKSNQVSISGSPADVDRARKRIRNNQKTFDDLWHLTFDIAPMSPKALSLEIIFGLSTINFNFIDSQLDFPKR
ncbi:unnamed protein product [Schistocephalus solidus]|uniref:KH domain-containing protein n=1 Tax=Schistocephalus solidus TaxID=70667 RepID=A0A183TCY4_SCHSO|nr:unnamed protein product [Schistocephalus solidus]